MMIAAPNTTHLWRTDSSMMRSTIVVTPDDPRVGLAPVAPDHPRADLPPAAPAVPQPAAARHGCAYPRRRWRAAGSPNRAETLRRRRSVHLPADRTGSRHDRPVARRA